MKIEYPKGYEKQLADALEAARKIVAKHGYETNHGKDLQFKIMPGTVRVNEQWCFTVGKTPVLGSTQVVGGKVIVAIVCDPKTKKIRNETCRHECGHYWLISAGKSTPKHPTEFSKDFENWY